MSSPIGQKQEITTSLMDAFYHTREAPPEFGFGTSVRPPLNDCEEAAPGPGAYTIKTTVLGDVPQSSIRSAPRVLAAVAREVRQPDAQGGRPDDDARAGARPLQGATS